MSRVRFTCAAMALSAALLVAPGCGDDEDTPSQAGSEEEAASDVNRYCELAAQLDQAGEQRFQEVEQDPKATREDFERVEAELLEENEDLIGEAQQVAPPEIESDLEVLVAGLRARAGLEADGPSAKEGTAAEKRVQQFERESCG